MCSAELRWHEGKGRGRGGKREGGCMYGREGRKKRKIVEGERAVLLKILGNPPFSYLILYHLIRLFVHLTAK